MKEIAMGTYCCNNYPLPSPMRLCGHLWLNTSLPSFIYLTLLFPQTLATRSKTVRCVQVLLHLEVISSSSRAGEGEEGRTSLRIRTGSLTWRHTPRLVSATGFGGQILPWLQINVRFSTLFPHYTYKMTFMRCNETTQLSKSTG